ncbi:hypothetical protein ELH91_00935 [Rhizobium leguminosarum]|uniref:hypothetical protein n=1 Tax=Rhizobium leguminosarum TaxID=384 RepID=UPI001030861B|nr:hypothetical protein [Rhizobium leguminosarum]TAY15437.1 hypothetical protein ELH91_00935 [Rhizobium leguminosarum]
MFQDISVGAIGAAIITAAISLIGLIVAKEQKVSDFRQAWIDALRSEMTSYLTSVNAVVDAASLPYKDQAEKVKTLGPLYSNLNSAHFFITLRLNPNEKNSKALLACMKAFQELASYPDGLTRENVKPVELDFLSASKDLLKYEWRRVKRGEPTFRLAKAALFVVLALAVGLIAFDYSSISRGIPNSQTPATP